MADNQWALMNWEKGDPTPKSLKKTREYHFSNGSSSTSMNTFTGSPRAILRGNSHAEHGAKYSSAPIEVPDWSKIAGINGNNAEDYQYNDVNYYGEDGEMIPPHDYIAKRLARTKILSHSMCEGNGRTLKGRDLRRVRNDILSKTGFLE